MAHQHESIDLTTLEQVHRLLSSTDFATLDEVGERIGPADLRLDDGRVPVPASVSSQPDGDSAAIPLPRRR